MRAGRRDHRQHLGLALHDREAPPAPAHAGRDRAAAGSGRWCSSTRWAARTIWCSTAPAWRSTRGGQVIARGAEHDADSGDGRRRRGHGRTVAPFDPSRRTLGAGGAGAGHARLRAPLRLLARRCSGCRAASTRRWSPASPRARSGPRQVLGRRDAVALFVAGLARRRGGAGARLGIDFCDDPDRADVRRLPRHAGAAARALRAARPPDAAAAAADLTEQNLQARVRGAILMALSNQLGSPAAHHRQQERARHRLLHAVRRHGGRPRGDQRRAQDAGLSPGPRGQRRRDAGAPSIPESTLTKPPSAELRPDQTDQDSLPPYDLLDAILEAHLVEGLDARGAGRRAASPPRSSTTCVRRVRTSEYKRRQMPPGLKITGKAFGPGRRYPIARAGD